MKIRVTRARHYRTNDLPHLQEALNQFHAAVNSIQFQHSIIHEHTPFKTLKHLSNEDIYNIIMGGREMGTEVDFVADLNLCIDENFSNVANGYMLDGVIYTFRNRFNVLTPSQLAGHYAHEYCHLLGFADPHSMKDIQQNVPYEVGRIIQEIAEEFTQSIDLLL